MNDSKGFFAYATARETIRVRKDAGEPRHRWTVDAVLSQYRFCNVFREDDKVTRWFADHVRGRVDKTAEGRYEVQPGLVADDDLLLATVLFRWFNRIETGEAMFLQTTLEGGTAWERFLLTRDTRGLQAAIAAFIGPKGPYVTGSYIIQGWKGHSKLPGVLRCVQEFMVATPTPPDYDNPVGFEELNESLVRQPGDHTLEEVWGWLKQHQYLGGFMAYEIVTDLAHTRLLCDAPDRMTWANPGPGAVRGLNRIHGRELHSRAPKAQMLDEMRDLLARSHAKSNWKWQDRPWDMRVVEHTLCEYDKYQRVITGEGRPRQIYK